MGRKVRPWQEYQAIQPRITDHDRARAGRMVMVNGYGCACRAAPQCVCDERAEKVIFRQVLFAVLTKILIQ